MLWIVISFEVLLKHHGHGFILESFVLNWYIVVGLPYKKLLLPLQCRLNTNLFLDSVKLIEYLASADIVVSSDTYVGLSPRTEISFFLLSTCTEELLSTQKIMTFLFHEPHANCKCASDPIP